jgi:hypothetical protein
MLEKNSLSLPAKIEIAMFPSVGLLRLDSRECAQTPVPRFGRTHVRRFARMPAQKRVERRVQQLITVAAAAFQEDLRRRHRPAAQLQGRVLRHQGHNSSSNGTGHARIRKYSVPGRHRHLELYRLRREEHRLPGSQRHQDKADVLPKIGPDSRDSNVGSRVALLLRISSHSTITARIAGPLTGRTADRTTEPVASLGKSGEVRHRHPIGREEGLRQRRQVVSGLIMLLKEAADSAGNVLRGSAAAEESGSLFSLM